MYRRTELDTPPLTTPNVGRLDEAFRQAREAMTAAGVMPRPELWEETERWARDAAVMQFVPAWMVWARYRQLLDAEVQQSLKGR